jgi:hypothetical protein
VPVAVAGSIPGEEQERRHDDDAAADAEEAESTPAPRPMSR